MNIIGEFYDTEKDLFNLVSGSKANLNQHFQVLSIEENAGWAQIFLKLNDSVININYSSCMFDLSILTEFLFKIIDLKEELILVFDNEGCNPLFYVEPNNTETIRLIFASDYELFNAFCKGEIEDYNLTDFRIDCDTIINKKILLEEFYKILYPFIVNYNFKEAYEPTFNQTKGLKYLTKIKKFLNKHII